MTPNERTEPRWQRLRENASRARRGVVILPSAFTLGNLFFGIYAIVSVWRGNAGWAAWCIVIAATLDYLDGRVARVTRTNTAFGSELDSLVDAISFGVAPALILIALHLQDSEWGWVVGFVYVAAVVVRLARFNVDDDPAARRHFLGLPTPSAGVLVATHSMFVEAALVQEHLPGLPWARIMVIATVLVSLLMVSRIPYAKPPQPNLRTRRGQVRAALLAGCVVLAVTVPAYWFFPATVSYALWGLLRSVLLGRPRRRKRRRGQRREESSPDQAPAEVLPPDDSSTDINQWKEERA